MTGDYDRSVNKIEQLAAFRRTLHGGIGEGMKLDIQGLPPETFDAVDRIQFVACGTSFNAARYTARWLMAQGVPAHTYQAGEYVSTPSPADDRTLVFGVTQSGETADTIEALRGAYEAGARTIAVTNDCNSTAARVCDGGLVIHSVPDDDVEIHPFASQAASLLILGEWIIHQLTGSPAEGSDTRLSDLKALPDQVHEVLDGSQVQHVVNSVRSNDAYFFIGRGLAHPVAIEGSLKFKEKTQRHAEGFAAGELKHGPLALVTEKTHVFALFTGRHTQKMVGNVEEVKARGASVTAMAPEPVDISTIAADHLVLPSVHPDVAGILASILLDHISDDLASLLDRPLDKPLAKSEPSSD